MESRTLDMCSTKMCRILKNSELREAQTESGNSRVSATKKRRFFTHFLTQKSTLLSTVWSTNLCF